MRNGSEWLNLKFRKALDRIIIYILLINYNNSIKITSDCNIIVVFSARKVTRRADLQLHKKKKLAYYIACLVVSLSRGGRRSS